MDNLTKFFTGVTPSDKQNHKNKYGSKAEQDNAYLIDEEILDEEIVDEEISDEEILDEESSNNKKFHGRTTEIYTYKKQIPSIIASSSGTTYDTNDKYYKPMGTHFMPEYTRRVISDPNDLTNMGYVPKRTYHPAAEKQMAFSSHAKPCQLKKFGQLDPETGKPIHGTELLNEKPEFSLTRTKRELNITKNNSDAKNVKTITFSLRDIDKKAVLYEYAQPISFVLKPDGRNPKDDQEQIKIVITKCASPKLLAPTIILDIYDEHTSGPSIPRIVINTKTYTYHSIQIPNHTIPKEDNLFITLQPKQGLKHKLEDKSAIPILLKLKPDVHTTQDGKDKFLTIYGCNDIKLLPKTLRIRISKNDLTNPSPIQTCLIINTKTERYQEILITNPKVSILPTPQDLEQELPYRDVKDSKERTSYNVEYTLDATLNNSANTLHAEHFSQTSNNIDALEEKVRETYFEEEVIGTYM